MRKWIISLSILLGVSAIGAGSVLGKIYKQEIKIYEQHLEEELSKESLKNIYITSDIPIRLETTKGKPYVEVESSLRGIVETEPQYRIDVKVEGDSSHIKIKEEDYPQWSMMMHQNQLATIYLPEQDINELSIKKSGYQILNYDIEDINVNHLDVEANRGNITLNGEYKTIKLDVDGGNININSKIPSELMIRGRVNADLKGQYNLIDMETYSGRINIDSSIPAKVIIQSAGEVRMTGSYKEIDIENTYEEVDIKSNTVCDLSVYSSSDMRLEGAFSKVDVKSQYGTINLINTIQPERINLFGDYHDVSITLPRDILGFEVTYKKDYEEQEIIYTDFSTKSGQAGKLIDKVQYGDNSSKIMIEGSNNSIYILEGSKQQ